MLQLYSWGEQGAEMKALNKAVRVLAFGGRVGALHLPGFWENSHSALLHEMEKQSTTGSCCCWRFSKENYNVFTIKYAHGVIFIEICIYRCKRHTNDV